MIKALIKIMSAIGRPLYTDGVTIEMQQISYVRVLVETDVSQPLVDTITLNIAGGDFQQKVENESNWAC